MFQTLIGVNELYAHVYDPEWLIIDNRFDLLNASWGQTVYSQSHIPGALFSDLEKNVCGTPTATSGRHPFPDLTVFHAFLVNMGLNENHQVVIYDQNSGAMASRLWWMLRFCGHTNVAVLNGGYQAWIDQGYPTSADVTSRPPGNFRCKSIPSMHLPAEVIQLWGMDQAHRIVDSRSPERYRGEVEPFYAKAGHIPGARNRFYMDNVGEDGRFLSPEELQNQFRRVLADCSPESTAFYCGSGVTATHNILAMEYAGLPGSRLYVGSWSEWIQDPAHEIALGSE